MSLNEGSSINSLKVKKIATLWNRSGDWNTLIRTEETSRAIRALFLMEGKIISNRLNPNLSKIPTSNIDYQSRFGQDNNNPFNMLGGRSNYPNTLGNTRPSMEGPLNPQGTKRLKSKPEPASVTELQHPRKFKTLLPQGCRILNQRLHIQTWSQIQP